MLLQDAVKPISYVKAHTAEIIRDITENRKTVIITQNGEAKAVLQDIAEYEWTQESLAMLKILALGRKDLDAGQLKPTGEAFTRIRERIRIRRKT